MYMSMTDYIIMKAETIMIRKQSHKSIRKKSQFLQF